MQSDHVSQSGQGLDDACYAELFRLHPAIMLLVDQQDGRIIDANEAASLFYGHSFQQFKMMKLADIVSEQANSLREIISSTEDGTRQLQLSHHLASGEPKSVEVELRVMFFSGKRHLLVCVRDVTQAKSTERQEQREVQRSRALMENTSVGVVLTVDRKIIFANRALASMLGYDPDQLIGQSARILYPDDASFQAQGEKSAERLKAGKAVLLEQELVSRDGSRIWVRSSGKNIDVNDPGAGTIWVSADITAEVQALAALRQNERYLHNAQTIARVGSWWMGSNPYTWTVSAEMASMFGIPQVKDGDFAPWVSRIHAEDRQRVVKAWNAALEGARYDIEYRIVVDGSVKWVDALADIDLDEQGKFLGAVGAVKDITERVTSEQELHKAREEAQAASRAKSQFLATMSHEIRTPLNVLIGTAHMMDKASLSDEARMDMEIIESSSRNLLSLINNILDLSKIESGEFQLDLFPFRLPILFEDLSIMFRRISAEKGVRFRVDISPEVASVGLVGDASRLKQIMLNLIGNAFKFTSKGEVAVHVTGALSDTGEKALITIAVSDTGVGISSEDIERLFQPYKQVDSTTSRKFGGTGLGLSIVRHLCTLMRGEVKLEGQPGVGTTVTLTLPLRLASPEETEAISRELPQKGQSIADISVLVVDDSDLNLRVIGKQLERMGVRAHLCTSGAEAIEAIRGAPHGYDVILMDVQMPEMDGFETTKEIRGLLQSPVPIVALTAGATVSEMQMSRESGMDDFLTKPINSDALRSAIVRLVENFRRAKVELAVTADTPQKAMVLPVIAGVDVEMTVASLRGDLSAFRRFMGRLVGVNANIVQDVRELLATGKVDLAMAQLHKVRGTAGQLGCRRLQVSAGALEDALYEALADTSRQMAEFEASAEEVITATQQWLKQPRP